MFELIVRAFIQDKNKKILLVKRAKEPEKGKWSLVGGKVEFGEKAIDAIVREIEEELQIHFLPEFVFYTENPDHRRKIHSLMLYYKGDYTGTIQTKPDEILEHKFLTLEELIKMEDIAWDHKKVLQRYITNK